jgi:acetyl-CoA C-acetyltransferase
MTDAVIVSTARTGLAKSWRGAFNMTHGATLGGHAVRAAVERAKVAPAEVEDILFGCALPEGATGGNIARQIAIRRGAAGHDRRRHREPLLLLGLQAIAMAAQRVIVDRVPVIVAGGVESISCVQKEATRTCAAKAGSRSTSPSSIGRCSTRPRRWRSDTASRARSRTSTARAASRRAAAAQAAGKFADEIVPMTTVMGMADKESSRLFSTEVTISADEGIRADTTYEAGLEDPAAVPGGVIAAGNASQFSDGASACVVMDAKLAEKRGLTPLGIFRGFAVAGCEPGRDGHRPRLRGAASASSVPHEGLRHRTLGAERGLRGAGDLLPRQARHSRRPS